MGGYIIVGSNRSNVSTGVLLVAYVIEHLSVDLIYEGDRECLVLIWEPCHLKRPICGLIGLVALIRRCIQRAVDIRNVPWATPVFPGEMA